MTGGVIIDIDYVYGIGNLRHVDGLCYRNLWLYELHWVQILARSITDKASANFSSVFTYNKACVMRQ